MRRPLDMLQHRPAGCEVDAVCGNIPIACVAGEDEGRDVGISFGIGVNIQPDEMNAVFMSCPIEFVTAACAAADVQNGFSLMCFQPVGKALVVDTMWAGQMGVMALPNGKHMRGFWHCQPLRSSRLCVKSLLFFRRLYPMRLLLIGFGAVGQGLAKILRDQAAYLQEREEFSVQIVGVATRSRGTLYHPDGLDIDALLNVSHLDQYPQTDGLVRGGDTLELIRTAHADVLVEASYSILTTGQPALDYCRAALESGK